MSETVKKYFFMILKLAVAGILLYYVGKDLDYGSLKKLSLPGLCVGFFLTMLLILLQNTLSALRWQMLLRGQQIRIRFSKVLSLTFQGTMFSLFMPGGSVGGDVVKGAVLAREAEKGNALEGVTTIFLDRLIGMLGLFSLAGIIVLCSLATIQQFSPAVRYTVYLLTGCCFGGVFAGIVVLFHTVIFRVKLFAWLLQKADILTKGGCSRILHSVEIFRKDRATLWKTFFLTLLILHPILIGCNVLILYGIQGHLQGIREAALGAALGNVASVAPVSPGGLGTRDKVTEVILRSSGLSPESSALVPLIYSCVSVLTALLGGLFFFLRDAFSKLRTDSSGE